MADHVTKNVWNVFELRGVCADPEGGRQDAWNKVGHRRGIIESERLLHGRPCDKNVWNVFELRGVCADPEGGRQDA